MTLFATTPDDVFRLLWWGMTLVSVVFLMQCYKVYLHRGSDARQKRLESKLDNFLTVQEKKLQTMVDTAVLVKTVAMSFNKEAKSTLKDVTCEVAKGVQVATDTASVLAASIVPPSGDKLPKPPGV